MTTWITLLNVLIGAGGIPLVVTLITAQKMPAAVKALVNLALSAVSGALTSLTISSHTDWKQIGLSIATTFIASAVGYYNLHLPLGTVGRVTAAKVKVGLEKA